jgi:hypothetical protein
LCRQHVRNIRNLRILKDGITMIINDNGTERNATAEEIAYYEAWQADIEAKEKANAKALANIAKAKQAVLDKLGLTADEVAALLS